MNTGSCSCGAHFQNACRRKTRQQRIETQLRMYSLFMTRSVVLILLAGVEDPEEFAPELVFALLDIFYLLYLYLFLTLNKTFLR